MGRALTGLAIALAAVAPACAGSETPPPRGSGMELPMASVTNDVTLRDTWETPYGLRITFTGEGPQLGFLFQHGEASEPVTVGTDEVGLHETLGFRWEIVDDQPGRIRLRVYEPDEIPP